MRVLHFFKTYWPDTFGGVERTIHAIIKGGEAYGIEGEVLSLSANPVVNSITFDGHEAHKAKLDLEFASTGFSLQAFQKFNALSREVDLIHYHFPWPFMDAVDLACRPKKPRIVTYHSDIVKQKVLLRAYKPLMYRFLRGMDRIVATSPAYAQTSTVLQDFRSRVDVIPIGLDEVQEVRVSPEELARWKDQLPRPFFLFVGVLRYYKGLHVLLQAMKEVDADLVIAGQGPLEAELKAQAAKAGLANVRFAGAISDDAKAVLLKLCTGFVFPSHLRSEAFGLSLLEAARFGKPMISCEIGTGTSFINVDNVTGVVVPPENPGRLANAMNRLLSDPATAHQWGDSAAARYKSLFTRQRMASAYAKLYRSLA